MDEAHLRFDHEVDGREFITSLIGPLFHDGLWIANPGFEISMQALSSMQGGLQGYFQCSYYQFGPILSFKI